MTAAFDHNVLAPLLHREGDASEDVACRISCFYASVFPFYSVYSVCFFYLNDSPERTRILFTGLGFGLSGLVSLLVGFRAPRPNWCWSFHVLCTLVSTALIVMQLGTLSPPFWLIGLSRVVTAVHVRCSQPVIAVCAIVFFPLCGFAYLRDMAVFRDARILTVEQKKLLYSVAFPFPCLHFFLGTLRHAWTASLVTQVSLAIEAMEHTEFDLKHDWSSVSIAMSRVLASIRVLQPYLPNHFYRLFAGDDSDEEEEEAQRTKTPLQPRHVSRSNLFGAQSLQQRMCPESVLEDSGEFSGVIRLGPHTLPTTQLGNNGLSAQTITPTIFRRSLSTFAAASLPAPSTSAVVSLPKSKSQGIFRKASCNTDLAVRNVTLLKIAYMLPDSEVEDLRELINESRNFLELAFDVVKEYKGSVHAHGPTHLTVVWNVLTNSNNHRQKACEAALKIKSNITHGLVTCCILNNDMTCGVVGTQDCKTVAVFPTAKGLSPELYHDFSEFLQGQIVCSCEIVSAAQLSFNFRPVDVIGEETLFVLVDAKEVGEDEWMYQLDEMEKNYAYASYDESFGLMLQGKYDQALACLEIQQEVTPDDQWTIRLGTILSCHLPAGGYTRKVEHPWQHWTSGDGNADAETPVLRRVIGLK